MPSRKGLEQATTWLRSKMAEGDTLDAINAEVCLNVIADLQKKRRVIGALYHQAHDENKRRREEAETRSFYEKMGQKYTPVTDIELPEGW